MAWRLLSWLAAWVFAALPLACSGDGPQERPGLENGEQNPTFCDASCDRAFQCVGLAPSDACTNDCVARDPGMDVMSPKAVEIIASCIRGLPCPALEMADAYDACWSAAKSGSSPTAATRRFCKTWSLRWFECGSSYSIERCENDWSIYEPSFLKRLEDCAKLECPQFDSCVDTVLGLP